MDARRMWILAAAACLVAALGQALLALVAAPRHWLLVDLSRSSSFGRDGFELAVGQALERAEAEARADGATLECIAYGAGARRVEPAALAPAARRAASEGGEAGSDLHAALALVEEAPGRVSILGDGACTAAAQARLDELARAGVESALLAAPERVRGDAQIIDLVAPAVVAQGARPQLVVVAGVALAPGEELVLRAVGADGVELAGTTTRPAAAGRAVASLSLPPWSAPGALVRVQALVVASATKVGSTRDEREVFVPCAGATTVDLLAPGEPGGAALELLREAGMLVRELAPGEVPEEPAEVLVELDPGRDDAARLRALAAGRGVVEVPGPRTLLAGAGASAALVPAPRDPGPREVHVLLDVSGSMAGDPMRAARGALSSLLDTFGAERELVLHPFSAALHEESRPRAKDVLVLPEPGGSTRLVACFAEVLARRVPDGAVLLVVGDGLDEDVADAPEGGAAAASARAVEARRAAEARGVRLGAVATGARPDRALLADMCGRVVDAGDLGAAEATGFLARALRRAGAESSIECAEAPARIEVVEPLLGAQLAASTRAAACAFALRAHPSAELVLEWRSESGWSGALAAWRRVGAGRVLGLAGPPAADATGFAPPPALASAVLAARAPAGPPRARVYEGVFQIAGLPPDAPAALEVVVRADGERRGALVAAAPARDGSVRQGDLTELARLAQGGRSVELEAAGFVLPLATALEPELPVTRAIRPSRALEVSSLRRAARASRWLLHACAACLCGAMLAPFFKAGARRGR